MDSGEALQFVTEGIGDRNLVWVCMRATDSAPLLELKQFSHCYSEISAVPDKRIETLSLEAVTGRRFGSGYGAAMTGALGAAAMRWIKSAVGRPAVLISYMPSVLVEMIMAMSSQVEYLNTPLKIYRAVEDKAYAEAGLKDHPDVKMIPWRQVSDDASRPAVLGQALRDGPLVLRSGVPTAGGHGHELILDEHQLARSRIAREKGPIHAGPYLSGVVVGMAGCVFPDGGIVLHVPQTSLVGIPRTTPLVFGDSGNDIESIKQVDPAAIRKLEAATRAAGEWLFREGFLGAYGIQAIVSEADCHFLEINPRFLGPMQISAKADVAMGRPNIVLDHLMAWLGHASYTTAPIAEMLAEQPSFSRIDIHNSMRVPIRIRPEGASMPEGFTADLLPAPGVVVEPGARVCVVMSAECVTQDGHSITEAATQAVDAALAAFEPVDAAG